MKHLLLSLCIFAVLTRVSAQDSTHNAIQLEWGFGNIMRQDMTVSPFVHSDWSPVTVRLSYERSKNLEQQVTFKFNLYTPGPAESYEFTSFYNGQGSTVPHSFKMIDFDYALGKVWMKKEKWSVSAGGKSRNFIYASEYYFGEAGPSPMMISFGLDVWSRIRYTVNDKNYIESDLSLPVFSYVYRNPYLTENDEYHNMFITHKGLKEMGNRIAAGELRSWGAAQRVELNIRYSHIFNEKWEIGLSYYHSTNMNQNPTKFTQFENTFLAGGKLNF